MALLLLSETAHAQISPFATMVGGGCPTLFCGQGIGGLAMYIRGIVLSLIGVVALFNIIRAGMKMIVSTEDDALGKARSSIGLNLLGIMLAFLSDRFVVAFYLGGLGGIATPTETNIQTGAAEAALQIQGVIGFFSYLIAALGVLMIIFSGAKALSSFGKEDAVTQMRNTVTGVITGIVLLIVGPAVKMTLGLATDASATLPNGTISASPVIIRVIGIVDTLLQFLGLVAVAIVIYAGILMILNNGNDEQYTKAKGLIVRALIGLTIVLVSFAAVTLVTNIILG